MITRSRVWILLGLLAAALTLAAKAAHDVVAMQQGEWEQEQRQKEEPSSHAIN